MKCVRFTISFDLDYVDERVGGKTARLLEQHSGDKDFVLGFLQRVPSKVSVAEWTKELEEIAKNKKVVGVGEIGLDYYSYSSNGIVDPQKQAEVFEAQIKLAHKLNLPLQIHNRHAGEDVVKILIKNKDLLLKTPGMFHCFASTREVLAKILEMGFYIGFDGNLTYAGIAKGESVELSTLCELTPLERIVTETDAPFLTPEPYRGGRNEPSYVIITGRKIAEIKAVSFEDLNKITSQNASNIFNL
jgi:TatD DNase family protein